MLGESVHAERAHEPSWRSVGSASLTPLVATVKRLDEVALLDTAAVAALAPGAVVLGETVLEAAVNAWRARLPVNWGVRRLLASSCGVGGRTLEALSKGADPELFNRLRDCAIAAKAAAAAADHDYGVVALLFLQGEQNNWGLDGGTTDKAEYKALMASLYQDFVADVAVDIAGQATSPAMFIYQTGGDYASEHMAIPQAQLELALELPGCFMAAPVYPFTGKIGHLDANGYRWMGAQFGKVMHRVLTLGDAWKPLHPVRTTLVGTRLFVDFHVPVPPLAWGRPFMAHAAIDVADRGFTVIDRDGVVPITGVQLDGATAVRLQLGRAPGRQARLRYADRAHSGRGSLHDSDATVAEDCYEYDATSGHYPSAYIAELVGRPYPLMNWCAAFDVPVLGEER